jgi:hypothetical protein
VLALAACAAQAQTTQRTPQTVVTIGTGPLRGTYYPAARAICRVVNRELRADNIRCSPETTYGSVYNLRMMQAGELDFALVQADVQHQAINGRGEWAGRPFAGLRAVFTAFDEAFLIVAAPDGSLRGVDDLRGRRVATGLAGSGTRATWDALAEVLGWQGSDRTRNPDGGDIAASLCGGALDAAAVVGFHPIAAVQAQLRACGTRPLPVQGALRDRLLATHPHFRAVAIPAETYGLQDAVETFGVATDFVTTARMDPRIVGGILRTVLVHRAEIAAEMPALNGTLDSRRAVAPPHPAAEAVRREMPGR